MYRAGFATKQEAYDKAVCEVFAALDRVEEVLSTRRYLTGSTLTEADVRLYTTLARFDCVYVGHFKVNSRLHYHSRGGSRNFEKGGSLEKMFTKKRSTVFLKPNQCSFSDHGLIDDSMTYIVAGDSRNGWNHFAL